MTHKALRFRVDDDTYARLVRIAELDEREMPDVVRRALHRGLPLLEREIAERVTREASDE